MKKLLSLILLTTLTLTACGSSKPTLSGTEPITPESFPLPTVAEDSDIYVGKIDGISDDFIRGVDVSEVISLEDSGVKYYANDGTEQDVFITLAQNGVNYVRIRVWNDPYDENGNGYGGGNCDLNKAITMGRRATQYGMRVLIDFHYSDFWADPVRQTAPKAWQGMSASEKEGAIYDFTKSSLEKLAESQVDVGMVQVGNETNFGMAGETNTETAARLIASGAKAVRDFSSDKSKDIKVAVHYTNATNKAQITGLLDALTKADADYDIVGLSYYMFWHGSQSSLKDVMTVVQNDYGKDVMMAEFSYPYTLAAGDSTGNSVDAASLVEPYEASVQGQSKAIFDMCKLTNEAGGIGVFYWGGTWVPVHATADMSESKLWETYGSGWASSYAQDYDNEAKGTYGGSAWDNQALFDFDGKALASLATFKYLAVGTNAVKPANYDELPVDKTLVITSDNESNLLKNPSFEDSDTSMWEINFEGTNPTDFQENEQDSYSGTTALHYWSESEMVFEAFQVVSVTETGTYTASLYSQGGDFNDQALFELFVLIDGDMYLSREFKNAGWANWQNPVIEGIELKEGQTVAVGVSVKANPKAWGTFDDFSLIKED